MKKTYKDFTNESTIGTVFKAVKYARKKVDDYSGRNLHNKFKKALHDVLKPKRNRKPKEEDPDDDKSFTPTIHNKDFKYDESVQEGTGIISGSIIGTSMIAHALSNRHKKNVIAKRNQERMKIAREGKAKLKSISSNKEQDDNSLIPKP